MTYRKKKCKVCKNWFAPDRQFQEACSIKHAIELVQIKKEAKQKKANNKDKKEFRLKDRSLQLRLAQIEFNKFIRIRDKDLPCISCQRHHSGKYDAGHYKSRGAHPELRFNEDNCHKQCSPCNTQKSGDIFNYRVNLKIKIGADRLQKIEGYNEPANYSIDDIIEIKDRYKLKNKGL